MRHVNGVYSQAYNRRHGLVGHVFQGRYSAIHVDGDAYFLEVCRYVDLNPVRAAIVGEPGAWPWSSYRAHAGLEEGPPWLDSATLHSRLLGDGCTSVQDHARAAALYMRWVRAGIGESLWPHALRQDIYLGDEDFVARVQKLVSAEQAASSEHPQPQLQAAGSHIDVRAVRAARELAMVRAYVQDGRTMSAIASEWNLSVSRVSRLIKRARRA
jgi:hypothetical protein